MTDRTGHAGHGRWQDPRALAWRHRQASKMVWAMPLIDERRDKIDREAFTAWAVENGIDARDVAADGFHITQDVDGSLTAHGIVYARDEAGGKIFHEASQSYHKAGARSWPVTSLPLEAAEFGVDLDEDE